MHVALYPTAVSAGLSAALKIAHIDAVTVGDVIAVTESEPPAGWDLVIVELGDEPALGLAFARRVREAALGRVLVVAREDHHTELIDAEFDDFVIDPVSPVELALRTVRLTSPSIGGEDETLYFKDLTLDLATYQAKVGSAPVDLTFMEYELLRFFLTNSGRVWSREQLLSQVWGYDYFGGARTVDVHVRRLRAKLGEERASWITTVRSVGYRFG